MGFPADETFYSNPTRTSPKEDTMTNYDYDLLAGQVRRFAYHLWATLEYEIAAYEAAHKLADEYGITNINAGNPDDSETIIRVVRECTNFFDPEDDSDWSDDEDDYVEWSEGDIVDGPTGLGIVLPAGEVWHLSDEKALSLMRGLSTMICHRLTQPWSADDESTILSRGIRKEA